MEIINKEKFEEKDIQKWEKYYNKRKNCSWFQHQYRGYYSFKQNKDLNENIIVPHDLLFHLINQKRPDLLYNFNKLEIEVALLEQSDYYWTKFSNYLGWTEKLENGGNKITLRLKNNEEHSILSVCWILLHEFRHVIQYNNQNIESCLINSNLEKWYNHENVSENLFNHVFHELLPFEIDANAFACEILEVNYPGSKFIITDETLAMLAEEKRKNENRL